MLKEIILLAAIYALNVIPAFEPPTGMDVAILVDGTPQVDDFPVNHCRMLRQETKHHRAA
jgi:hypothetical protein